MDRKVRNFFKKILLESEESEYLNADIASDIEDVDISEKDDFVKIQFQTSDNRKMCLVVKHKDFINWLEKNFKGGDFFLEFVKQFLDNSYQVDNLNEIVDDDGNIMPSIDKPNNSTNRMVGSSVFDIEKVYRQSIPKTLRFYSGDLGIGIITW